jgi:hypothetical protein
MRPVNNAPLRLFSHEAMCATKKNVTHGRVESHNPVGNEVELCGDFLLNAVLNLKGVSGVAEIDEKGMIKTAYGKDTKELAALAVYTQRLAAQVCNGGSYGDVEDIFLMNNNKSVVLFMLDDQSLNKVRILSVTCNHKLVDPVEVIASVRLLTLTPKLMISSRKDLTLEQLCQVLPEACVGLLNRADFESIIVINDQGNVIYSSNEKNTDINQIFKNKLKQIKLAASVNLPDLQVIRLNFGKSILYCSVFASGWLNVAIKNKTHSNMELIKTMNDVIEDCYRMSQK